ncbi:Regulator of G-protein signaling 4 [Taenia crassiceps]|uniref:Regulator of G-protein signaling 4 n=1 Tax=Taenia crassiceps TaxID=6207 RepID=A0ABR4Q550_9CEST
MERLDQMTSRTGKFTAPAFLHEAYDESDGKGTNQRREKSTNEKTRSTSGKGKCNSQPGSPVSRYESSPERVTKQNQLLQPALLPRPSRASSEVNITEIGETRASDACSKSENAFPPPDRVPQEITHLKGINSKRMNWVKLIRLQLNALHEKKSKGPNFGKSALEAKTSEAEPHNTSPTSREDHQPSIPKDQSPSAETPSEPPQHPPVPLLVVSDAHSPPLLDADHKGIPAGGDGKKRTSNVRGRISQFWRQTAAAALRHQKQAEEAVGSTSASASNPEEAITQRVLTTIFKHSWPTLQQVTCWQQSFQNLLQDPHGLLVFREFLQGEFSDENLEFWIACQKYKALTDESLQRLRAQEIYDGFIAFQSQREVNLDCETRIQTELRLSQAEPDLFDASQKRIEALMEKDPYRRFLRSALYLKLIDLCQEQEGSNPSPTDDKAVEPRLIHPKPSNSASVH